MSDRLTKIKICKQVDNRRKESEVSDYEHGILFMVRNLNLQRVVKINCKFDI